MVIKSFTDYSILFEIHKKGKTKKKKQNYQSTKVPLYFPGSHAAIEILLKIGDSIKLNSDLLTT